MAEFGVSQGQQPMKWYENPSAQQQQSFVNPMMPPGSFPPPASAYNGGYGSAASYGSFDDEPPLLEGKFPTRIFCRVLRFQS